MRPSGSPAETLLTFRQADGKVIVQAPEYCIIRDGTDREAVTSAVLEAVAVVEGDYRRLGVGSPVTVAASVSRDDRFLKRTAIIVLAVFILLTAVLVPVGLAVLELRRSVEARVTEVRKEVAAALSPRGLSIALGDISKTLEDMTPERRQQIASDLEKIARDLEPFAVRIRPLFCSEDSPTGIAPLD